MLVTFLGQLAHEFESMASAIGEVDRHFLDAAFEHVVEDRILPGLRGFALVGRPIFERVAFVGLGVVPANAAALEIRVQRIDEDHPARQADPSAQQRSQKPRIKSFSGRPVRPWLTSQFIRRRRGVSSICYYAAQS